MQEAPEVTELLARLPWFRDLSKDHRRQMIEQITQSMDAATSRDEYTTLLEQWAVVAHIDQKWARFELLRESGLLSA
jgi:hypothetical protein